ncbi:MAG: diphthine--ammonia ligase [Bacteroidetes bacterium]|nr:diphthine--ammonia ligase [Bacteroidota bacterium]
MNWSGGKDSSLALWKVLRQQQYHVRRLLTSVNAVHNRISMHGVRRELLEAQARALGLPLTTIELPEQPGMAEYEAEMMKAVTGMKQQGIGHSIFGDIFLEDLRRYREEKLRSAEIDCVFPIWKIDTPVLMREFLDAGFKAIIVCINEKYLDKSFCGRLIDQSFCDDLPAGVDICGENGEFHSYVFDGPIFPQPIPVEKGETVYRRYAAPTTQDSCNSMDQPSPYGFWFCDLFSPQ